MDSLLCPVTNTLGKAGRGGGGLAEGSRVLYGLLFFDLLFEPWEDIAIEVYCLYDCS